MCRRRARPQDLGDTQTIGIKDLAGRIALSNSPWLVVTKIADPVRRMTWLLVLGLLLFGLARPCAAIDTDLNVTIGKDGLSSLTFLGHEFLAKPWSGNVRPVAFTPKLMRGGANLLVPNEQPRVVRDASGPGTRYDYSWGVVEVSYALEPATLKIRTKITNTSADTTIQTLELQLIELHFPIELLGRGFEAGMWGNGGGWGPLHAFPLVATRDRGPPAILMRYMDHDLAFAQDNAEIGSGKFVLSVPFTTEPATKLAYPMRVEVSPLTPGQFTTVATSLRFSRTLTSSEALVGDVLETYRRNNPQMLSWPSRAPIGALFLATSQQHPPKNPRGWFLNAADVDVTTPEGLKRWRRRLMDYAEASITILKEIGAQGMITWDPEGQEYPRAAFYGAPNLAARLAPEADFKGDGQLGALDEYFSRFRAAGLRTGLTLRPQHVIFDGDGPLQVGADDPTGELLAKIDYARRRWGCTIFYIDSTTDKQGALPADVMKTLAERHPDALLLPENESLRYFAYSAPLNSFAHHNVAQTPPSVREVYPNAFSAIMITAPVKQMTAGYERLAAAVAAGDIMIVNAWYGGEHIAFVKRLAFRSGSHWKSAR
jgi:hypothetical protein